jgi:hypothetical protein
MLDDITLGVPMGRVGRTDEIASADVFLATDQCNYMTGANFSSTAENRQIDFRRPRRAITPDERDNMPAITTTETKCQEVCR